MPPKVDSVLITDLQRRLISFSCPQTLLCCGDSSQWMSMLTSAFLLGKPSSRVARFCGCYLIGLRSKTNWPFHTPKGTKGRCISFKHSSWHGPLSNLNILWRLKQKCQAQSRNCQPRYCMCSPQTNSHHLRLPVWIASLLRAAKRLRSDGARRKKVYRLLHRKLVCAHAVIQIRCHSHSLLSLHLHLKQILVLSKQ